jgi:hypothetical protein
VVGGQGKGKGNWTGTGKTWKRKMAELAGWHWEGKSDREGGKERPRGRVGEYNKKRKEGNLPAPCGLPRGWKGGWAETWREREREREREIRSTHQPFTLQPSELLVNPPIHTKRYLYQGKPEKPTNQPTEPAIHDLPTPTPTHPDPSDGE